METQSVMETRRGAGTGMSGPHPHMVDKNRRDTSGERDPTPVQTTQPRVPAPGRKVPITSGGKKTEGIGAAEETAGFSTDSS